MFIVGNVVENIFNFVSLYFFSKISRSFTNPSILFVSWALAKRFSRWRSSEKRFHMRPLAPSNNCQLNKCVSYNTKDIFALALERNFEK